MIPVGFPDANVLYSLPDGDGELPVHSDGQALTSVWVFEPGEAELLVAGGLVSLTVHGDGHPPVLLEVRPPWCPAHRTENTLDPEVGRFVCGACVAADGVGVIPDPGTVTIWPLQLPGSPEPRDECIVTCRICSVAEAAVDRPTARAVARAHVRSDAHLARASELTEGGDGNVAGDAG